LMNPTSLFFVQNGESQTNMMSPEIT
jgi:hypothetical protein